MRRILFVFFVLFVMVPFVELMLLLKMAQATNIKTTILFVILTGIAGSMLIRHHGWQTYRRIQEQLRDGQMPGDALLDGLFVFTAGVLLLTPGMLTDFVAMSLLIPFTRSWYKSRLSSWIKSHFRLSTFTSAATQPTADPQVVDSYVVRRSPDDE